MTLTEFLLARIAEDEGRLVHDFECDRFEIYDYGSRTGSCDCTATAQLLAECAAKRRIVEEHPADDVGYCGDNIGLVGCKWLHPCPTLRHLAAVYADHADYRDEWKP